MYIFREMITFAPTYVALFWAIVLLLEQGPKNKAKHLLGFFMLSAVLLYLSHAIYFNQYYFIYLSFEPFYILSSLLVYPLFYWYLKMLTIDSKYNYRNLWHLTPAVILFILSAIVYLLMDNRNEYAILYLTRKKRIAGEINLWWKMQSVFFIISRFVFAFQVVLYLVLGLKLIHKYEKRIANFYSNIEGHNVSWAKWLIVIFSFTATMSSLANITGRPYFSNKPWLIFIPAFIFSSLLFIMGLMGFRQKLSVADLISDEKEEPAILHTDEKINTETEELIDSNNLLFGTLKKQLLFLFDNQKIFLHGDLKISTVCQQLNTNRTYVSKLINSEFNSSFSDFVNKYRVAEAKKILENKTFAEINLEQVAEQSGFPSVASMIRIFKAFEGVTPGSYRNQFQQKS